MSRERFDRTTEACQREGAAVATALTVAGSDTWEHVADNEACWYFQLQNQHGHKLHVDMSDCDKKSNPKYSVTVSWPGGRSHRHNAPEDHKSFGCGYDRGVDALAQAIQKRVMPYLLLHWQERLDEIARLEGNEDTQLATVQRLEKRFGREQAEHNKGGSTVYGTAKTCIYRLQVNHDGTAATVDMSRGSLPIETVFALIDWLEANGS